MDLVEISPMAKPPVCRIMDYGRFKYETSKKEKASKKHQATIVLKEIKLRPKTDEHDLDFKIKHVRRFLSEGNKCKLVVIFRGREIVHPETGQAVIDAVFKAVEDISQVEHRASMEGRRMIQVLAPKSGVVRPPPKGKPAVGVEAITDTRKSPATAPGKTAPLSNPALSADALKAVATDPGKSRPTQPAKAPKDTVAKVGPKETKAPVVSTGD